MSLRTEAIGGYDHQPRLSGGIWEDRGEDREKYSRGTGADSRRTKFGCQGVLESRASTCIIRISISKLGSSQLSPIRLYIGKVCIPRLKRTKSTRSPAAANKALTSSSLKASPQTGFISFAPPECKTLGSTFRDRSVASKAVGFRQRT